MMMDYATNMVDDALSAVTLSEPEQCLHNWLLFSGDVLDSEGVTHRLRAGAAHLAD